MNTANFDAWVRVPENCVYTAQHDCPDVAQIAGASVIAGLGVPNGGLQVVNPAQATYDQITERLASSAASGYEFADQSLLGDLFYGRWVALPYIYNALKTMRRKGVHDAIWRDDNVKNVHYILNPKPWDELSEKQESDGNPVQSQDPSYTWWTTLNKERLAEERERNVNSQF